TAAQFEKSATKNPSFTEEDGKEAVVRKRPRSVRPNFSLREVVESGTNGAGLLASRQRARLPRFLQWRLSGLLQPAVQVGLSQWRGRAGFAPDFRMGPVRFMCGIRWMRVQVLARRLVYLARLVVKSK